MAQINEEQIIIKISTLSADGVDVTTNISNDLISTLQSVTLELINEGAIVEIITETN